ncbi:hypothetical protein AeRB84_021324 [Aphanomyces euteiches]|nr:hypothetical protein AeRB84_021324 [Aphanomyces euteiches]
MQPEGKAPAAPSAPLAAPVDAISPKFDKMPSPEALQPLVPSSKGMDVYIALAKADSDNDSILSTAQFKATIESLAILTAREKSYLSQALEAGKDSIALSSLQWLYASTVHTEWQNMFAHPFEAEPAMKRTSNHAQPSQATKASKSLPKRTSTTSRPKPTPHQPWQPPRGAKDGIWMTEEQLIRLIEAVPQKKHTATGKDQAKQQSKPRPQQQQVKPTTTQPRQPVKNPSTTEGSKSKTMFIREAIPLALKNMTEMMQMALQRTPGDTDGKEPDIGIWLTAKELDHVVETFLSTSAIPLTAMPLASMPPLDMCETLLDSSTKCHLCLATTAEFWCCECTTALCPDCLHDVGCKQMQHHVEVYTPSPNKPKPADVRPAGANKMTLTEKRSQLDFLPLTVGASLAARLRPTRMHGHDTKTLKQLCMLVRKQIEMQPLSKVILDFLERSSITKWTPNELQCFLDVIQIPSGKFIERNVSGDQFLRLSVVSLHDTYGVVQSFQLHRCLFYRSLLALLDEWLRFHSKASVAPPPIGATTTPSQHVKPKKKCKKAKPKHRGKFSWASVKQEEPPTAEKDSKTLSDNQRQESLPARKPARTRPTSPAKPFVPVKKLHSQNDESLVQAIQEGMKQINLDAPARFDAPEIYSNISGMQRQVMELAQRLQFIQGETAAGMVEATILQSIDHANELLQRLLVMTPLELESKAPLPFLAKLIIDIEEKLAKKTPRKSTASSHSSRPLVMPATSVAQREAQSTSTWIYEMAEPEKNRYANRMVTPPGPTDYNTDNARAFPIERNTIAQAKRATQGHALVKNILSDLGFDDPNEPPRSKSAPQDYVDEDSVVDPPPFDVDEFIEQETIVKEPSELFDTSFLSKETPKEQRSQWQRLRAKYAPPESNDVKQAMAALYYDHATPSKSRKTSKPPKKASPKKPEPVCEEPQVSQDWAKRIQANYKPLAN